MSKFPRIVTIICGPTASGKSTFAIDYSLKNNGVIINCDSQQIYKDLNILTARPNEKDLREVPHKLYGFLTGIDNIKNFSVVSWLKLACREINNAFDNQCNPILVGGTGFYISALINGISIIPEIKNDIRNYVRSKSNNIIYADLKKYDPEIANNLSSSDTQRIMRALEVFLSTGKKLSDWQKIEKQKFLTDTRFNIIYKNPAHDILLKNISNRAHFILNNGAINEVRNFLKLNYPLNLSVSKSIGVFEIKQYLDKLIDFDTLENQIIIKTRQYAKRQNTWFRNQLKNQNITVIDSI